ncbi:MAG: nitroreductase family protein [Candidatus Brockarchaeota archaeon]|nr:nitroreductase family protein [Candidatus Brockarchaeota archaeon]
MDVYEAAIGRRTTRRFKQDAIGRETLEKLVNAARLAPSAMNLQPCEYVVVDDPRVADEVFKTLRWAAYIAPEGDPKEGERPVAYIVVLLNRKKRETGGEVDAAAAIENILLTAYGEGLGSCWLGSVDRERLSKVLRVPEHCRIDSVVALGYAAEKPVLEEMAESVRYWKDGEGVLHVPKRRLEDVIHFNVY